MLHSGSRNVGKTIGETAMDMAKKVAEQGRPPACRIATSRGWTRARRSSTRTWKASRWAQEYASLNRDLMLHLVHKRAREGARPRGAASSAKSTNCHHNYARIEEHFGENVWVTRKGAV